MQNNHTTTQGSTPAYPLDMPGTAPARRIILPGDRVLVYDNERYRWHEVAGVLLGERTKIQIVGASFYFDEGIVMRHRKGARG
jgi:hypothetical protein